MSKMYGGLALAAAVVLAPAAHAGVAWNEAVNGDFSNEGLSPSFVALAAGSNQIIGATGDTTGGGPDLDYFRITVPAGSVLSSITVLPGTTLQTMAFFGIQSGTQVTTSGATELLGWILYERSDVGSDILPRIGQGVGSIGFTGALPAGNYAFWIQDYDTGASPYQFDFAITPVPEPATALLWMAGLIGAGALGARRREGSARM